jgi:hypothetical protein
MPANDTKITGMVRSYIIIALSVSSETKTERNTQLES